MDSRPTLSQHNNSEHSQRSSTIIADTTNQGNSNSFWVSSGISNLEINRR